MKCRLLSKRNLEIPRKLSNMETLRYHRVAIWLHWSIAILIIANIALALFMDGEWIKNIPTDIRFGMYQWHKTFGLFVLLLSLFRVAWRLTHRPPPLPEAMPKLEKIAAHVGHLLLYGFMIFVPFTGWLMVSASTLGIPTLLFGIIPWPHLPIKSMLANQADFARDMSELHGFLAYSMLALLSVHIAAALRHYFWLKDGILQRMLPNRKIN